MHSTISIPAGSRGSVVSVRRLAPWAAGLVAALLATPAGTQGNIDAGKSPAQIFGDTCAGCHKSARELKRTSASFLRSHYTTGSEEAAAMASYLTGVGSDPRAASQPKRKEEARQTPAEAAKQNPRQQADQASQANQANQAKSKGGRTSTTAQARPAVEEKPPEPPPSPPPVLEAFEE